MKMVEQERGCGWRQAGGFYLIGDGMSLHCDALPIDLDPCSECGYVIPKSRGMQMIHSGYLKPKILFKHATPNRAREYGEKVLKNCTDDFPCPICQLSFGDKFAVMTVSSRFYTPTSFMKEATKQGVSKRVRPDVLPKEFKLGETWVFLAHAEAIEIKRRKVVNKDQEEPEYTSEFRRGLFYAFKPSRIEAVVDDTTPAAKIAELHKKGYNVVKVPYDNPKFHKKKANAE
jgi:hypothetical protein